VLRLLLLLGDPCHYPRGQSFGDQKVIALKRNGLLPHADRRAPGCSIIPHKNVVECQRIYPQALGTSSQHDPYYPIPGAGAFVFEKASSRPEPRSGDRGRIGKNTQEARSGSPQCNFSPVRGHMGSRGQPARIDFQNLPPLSRKSDGINRDN